MSSFGFGKPAEKREKTIDKAGLPRGPIVVDPASERDAVARGEQLGYVDRGQTDTQPSGAAGRGGRKRPPAPPSQTLYIRAPQELAEWFERYTEQRGHRALWNSIEDIRKLVEQAETADADRPASRRVGVKPAQRPPLRVGSPRGMTPPASGRP